MKRLILASFLFFLLPILALADPLSIEKKHCISNRSPGYCAWASLETLGRHNKVEPLYDLVEKRSKESGVKVWENGEWKPLPKVMVSYGYNYQGPWIEEDVNVGTCWGIYWKLTQLNVKFKQQWDGNMDTQLITDSIEQGLGCSVGCKSGAFGKGSSAHAVTCVELTDTKFKFIDPNYPDKITIKSRNWFNSYFSGWILVVYPESK